MKQSGFIFERINFILLISGLLLIALGYILMIGGGSDDPHVFNPEIFSPQRITIAPIILLCGFVMEIVAIMWRGKGRESESSEE